jgi:hypothetical protein
MLAILKPDLIETLENSAPQIPSHPKPLISEKPSGRGRIDTALSNILNAQAPSATIREEVQNSEMRVGL